MAKPLLSIIVPIYNVEKYISTCLESILCQIKDNRTVEVILINDGTKDRSALIAFDLIKDSSNAWLYNQENQGLSMARNNGLKYASGEYVWFVDSDDSIADNCLTDIMEDLSDEPDMLQLNYQFTYEDGTAPKPVARYNSEIISGKDAIIQGVISTPAQFTVFRRQFLENNNLRFVEGIYHEDSEFKPRATYLAKSIKWHQPIVYNYLQRSTGSITSKFKLKNGIDMLTVVNNLHKFSENKVREPRCKAGFYRSISTNMNTILLGIRSLNNDDYQSILALLRQQKHVFKDMMKSGNLKFILEGFTLYLNTSIGVKLHSLLR